MVMNRKNARVIVFRQPLSSLRTLQVLSSSLADCQEDATAFYGLLPILSNPGKRLLNAGDAVWESNRKGAFSGGQASGFS